MTDIRVIIREFSRGTSLREMERKLKLSRTSLRNYRDRAEASGRSMVDLLALNDAELQAIMLKGDGHRGRDSDRYGFMQERVEDYARDMTRKHMTYDVLYEEYQKSTDNPYGYTQFKAIIQELEFHFNASFSAINLAKVACKELGMPFSVSSCKSMIHNAYMLERFICVSGMQPDPHIIDKLFKELVLFTARAA